MAKGMWNIVLHFLIASFFLYRVQTNRDSLLCQFSEPKIVKMRDPTFKPGEYGQAATVAPSAD